jgi:hypothetical protein
MIHHEQDFRPGSDRRPVFKVIRGGQEFDHARLAGALAALDSYIDGLLAATDGEEIGGRADEVIDLRLASL